jgi:hypothetical protein
MLSLKVEKLGVLHTMAVGLKDKAFQQFDWWREKVCPLGLHIEGNNLQNAYIAALFVISNAKSLFGR